MALSSFLSEHSSEICERYAEGVEKASSKVELASLLDINVCEWLCMMQPVHHVSEWVEAYLANYTNGRFTKDCNGYTCEVWCGYTGEIALEADVTALVGCKAVTVVVPEYSVKRVFASGGIVEAVVGENARLFIEATDGTEVSGDGVEAKHINHYM